MRLHDIVISGLKTKPEIKDPQEFVNRILVRKLSLKVGQRHRMHAILLLDI